MSAASPARPEVVRVQQDEVLTGEAVALDVQPVGYVLRAFGTLIDMLLSAVFFLLLSLVSSWMRGRSILDGSVGPILAIVIVVLAIVVLPVVVETLSHGRSVGRLVVGARIVRADGGGAGLRQAFIRALAGVFELWMTAGAVAALVGAFTPRSQRLGDLMAGTYSERTRAPRLPDAVATLPAELIEWSAMADVARLPPGLARRCARFVHQAAHMDPGARLRLAASLAVEASVFVAPLPPVAPETLVRAVVAVRRERELRALRLQDARVVALTAGSTGAPRGFPKR